MSGCNCCFLTCIQVSQEASKVIWYSQLLKSFPQFLVIHTVKGSSKVNEAEIDVFLEFPYFLYEPTNVGNLISGSSAFSESSLNIWKFTAWRILSITLLGCEMITLLACENPMNSMWCYTADLILTIILIKILLILKNNYSRWKKLGVEY